MIGVLSTKRCSICEAQLRTIPTLPKHLANQEFTRPLAVYACPNCDKLEAWGSGR